jgi:hypothetical protein
MLGAAGHGQYRGGAVTAILIRQNTKAAWLTGIDARAQARKMIRRGLDCAAATVLACAVGAALLQLAAEVLSFPAPIAATAITVMAAAVLNSLRRRRRTQAGRVRSWSPAKRPAISRPDLTCPSRQAAEVAAQIGAAETKAVRITSGRLLRAQIQCSVCRTRAG